MSALSRLSPRERLLIGAILPLALAFAGYRLVWHPVQIGRVAAKAEIAAYTLIADRAATAATPGATVAPVAERDPLATRVTRSADLAGLELRRLEPDGDRLRVSIDAAAFSRILGWLAELQDTEAVTVAAIELDRRVEPGVVSAQITLETM